MKDTLGTRISLLLANKNLTQKEFAKLTGLNEVTVGRYINDKREPSASVIKIMAETLNVSTDYLLGKSNIKNPYSEESLPDEITTADEAIKFLIEDSTIFGFDGFDVNKLSDEEKIEFANELLNQFRLVSYKYKK